MKPALVKPGLFRDRREAGRLLAEKLAAYAIAQTCSSDTAFPCRRGDRIGAMSDVGHKADTGSVRAKSAHKSKADMKRKRRHIKCECVQLLRQ